MSEFGDRLRQLRKSEGKTLDQLAAESGSSKSYIWELENRDVPRPSAEKLARIAEVLGVTTDYLLGTEESLETAEDKAFFRKYNRMDAPMRAKLRQMAKILDKDS